MPGNTPKVQSVRMADGVRLELHSYAGGLATPALCLHGLTRNARDFETVAPRLAGGNRDVFALSFRGRGGSDRDPDFRNYHAATYRDDVLATLDALQLPRVVLIGTSLGGIVSMLVHSVAPERVAGVVINDIGPDLAPAGIARIAGLVASTRPDAADLDEAAAQIRAVNELAFPGRDGAFWRAFALRTYRGGDDGRYALDYDQAIGRALLEATPTPDLWDPLARLSTRPTLVIRGALSDLLTPEIVGRMRQVHPNFEYCEVAGVGHAPMLDEPEAAAAIDRFMARLD